MGKEMPRTRPSSRSGSSRLRHQVCREERGLPSLRHFFKEDPSVERLEILFPGQCHA